jgi:chromosome segregation ATPase
VQTSAISPEVQAQLQAAGETEQMLRAELQAAQAEVEGLQKARDEIEQTHAEQAKAQQSQLDQARAQARMAEEERQRSLAEAAQSATAEPAIAPDVAARIDELEQQLQRSEHERAMLRAGRPETVYEARNRELEDELARLRDQLRVAEDRARSSDAATAGVDPGVIGALEERITAAEERARDAERRLDEAKPRGGSRSRTPRGNGNGDATPPEAEGADAPTEDDAEKPAIDGSELRSRLVRSTDAKRRGATPVPEDARSSRAGRPRR